MLQVCHPSLILSELGDLSARKGQLHFMRANREPPSATNGGRGPIYMIPSTQIS